MQINRYSKYQENLAKIYQHQRERKERKRENLLMKSQTEIAELKEELDKIKKRILQWVKISGRYTAEYNKTVFYRNNCGKRELTLNYIIKHVLIYFYNVCR